MAQHIDAEAMAWVVKVGDPAFTDWDGYMAWLAADPVNSERYDAAASALKDAERLARALTPTVLPHFANDEAPAAPQPRRRLAWKWGGSALAAGVAGVLGLTLWQARPQPYTIATAAGQQHVIALSEGSRIVMAGGTRLTLDHANPRVASVVHGEAIFDVRHQPSSPFEVKVGDIQVTDVGTVFDIKHTPSITRVAVAEGAVMIDPDGAAVKLTAGQAVQVSNGVIRRQSAVDVGSWRTGRLTFDDASLEEIANDLTRTLGRPVSVDKSVARQTRTATIELVRLNDDPAFLGRILDVDVTVNERGWTLRARD